MEFLDDLKKIHNENLDKELMANYPLTDEREIKLEPGVYEEVACELMHGMMRDLKSAIKKGNKRNKTQGFFKPHMEFFIGEKQFFVFHIPGTTDIKLQYVIDRPYTSVYQYLAIGSTEDLREVLTRVREKAIKEGLKICMTNGCITGYDKCDEEVLDCEMTSERIGRCRNLSKVIDHMANIDHNKKGCYHILLQLQVKVEDLLC